MFDRRKLVNFVWFFGFMTLTLAATIGMAWAYCGFDSKKQKRRTSGENADILFDTKGSDQ